MSLLSQSGGFLSKLSGRPTLTGLALVLIAVPISSFAQDSEPGGLRVTFDIASDFRTDDNLNLDPNSAGRSTFMTHVLSFGILSETRTEKFQAGLSGTLRYGEIAGGNSTTGFGEPHALLAYSRETGNSRLALDLDYVKQELNFQTLGEEPDKADLIPDTGTLARTSAGFSFETGLNAPFSFALNGRYDRRAYSGTSDPDLYNSDTISLSAIAGLRFSSDLDGRIEISRQKYSAQNATQTDRETFRFGFGLTGNITRTLTFDALVSWNRIDSWETLQGARSKTAHTGTSAALTFTQEMSNGTFTAAFNSDFSTLGNRHTLSVGRNLELPSGALSVTIGASKSDIGNSFLVGSLHYSQELASGNFIARFERSVTTSTENEELSTIRLGLGYQHQLNTVSTLDLSLDYYQFKGFGSGATTDRQSSSFKVAYNRALTPDWILSAGYERRYLARAGYEAAHSNVIFASLNRSFSFSP